MTGNAVRPVIIWLLRLVLAGVFLAAAVPKIQDPAGFAKAVFNYQLLPDALINPLAVFLPWLELVAALALMFVGPLRRGALWVIGAMTMVFIGAIGAAMARGINIDCGCFSTSGEGMKTGWLHELLDVGLLICCFVLARLDQRRV